jgi:ribose transport system permease protein
MNGAGGPDGRRVGLGRSVRDFVARFGVVVMLAVLFIGFSIAMPDTFFTGGNIKTMVNAQAIVLMLAIAASIALRSGDFDLSIPGVMTVCAALTAILVRDGAGLPVVLAVVLAVGLLVGLANGLLIVKLGVDAFVTTLGMLTALGGIAYGVTNNDIIAGITGPIVDIAQWELFGLPGVTWYGWVLVLVAWYVYERTPLGRYLLFVGGGRDATRLAGVPVDRVRIGAFMASAVVSALAGMLLVGYLGSIDPSVTNQFLLQPFAAAFLGATTIAVGRFNALGTLAGMYLLVVGITGLQLLGAQSWVSDVFNGFALVLAVALARIAVRSREKLG